MKKFKRFLTAAAVLAAAALITGCGGELTTNMNLSSDFSGSRVMTLVVNKADNQEYVNGDPNAVTSTVSASCPEQLEFSATDDGTNVIYTFTLNFSSKEDYEAKVRALLGDEVTPDEQIISYAAPDSVFASGVRYDETFSSEELLSWFEDLMINAGYIDSGNRSYIFDSNSTYFSFDNASMESDYSSRVDVDTLSFRPINGVEFYTKANSDGTFDRTIVVSIPQATMDQAGEEIKAFLEPKAEGAEGRWESAEGVNSFIISGTNLTAESVDAMTKNFTGKPDDTFFSLSDAEDSEEATEAEETVEETEALEESAGDAEAEEEIIPGDPYILYVHNNISENINLEDFITNEDGEVNFSYYGDTGSEYTGLYSEGGVSVYDGGRDLSMYYDEEKPQYYELFDGDNFIYSAEYETTGGFSAESIEVTVKPEGLDKAKQEVSVNYTEVLSESALTALKEKLTAAAEGTGISVDACEASENGFNVKVSASGSLEENADAWTEFADGHMDMSVQADKTGLLSGSKTMRVAGDVDLKTFTNKPVDTVTLRVKGIGKPVDEFLSDSFEGSDYVLVREFFDPTSDDLSYSVTAKKSNFLVYALYILTIAAIANLVYRLKDVILIGVGKASIKAKEASEKAARAKADKASAGGNGESAKPAKKFCGSCGAENEADAGFCEKCGAKLD